MSSGLRKPDQDRPDQVFHYTTLGVAVVAALLSGILNAISPFLGMVLGVALVTTGFACILRPRRLRVWRLAAPMGALDSLCWVSVGVIIIAMGYLSLHGMPVETLLQR